MEVSELDSSLVFRGRGGFDVHDYHVELEIPGDPWHSRILIGSNGLS